MFSIFHFLESCTFSAQSAAGTLKFLQDNTYSILFFILFITLSPLFYSLASSNHPEPNRWAVVTATHGSCSCVSVSTRGNE